jgi:hypothetical protein
MNRADALFSHLMHRTLHPTMERALLNYTIPDKKDDPILFAAACVAGFHSQICPSFCWERKGPGQTAGVE